MTDKVRDIENEVNQYIENHDNKLVLIKRIDDTQDGYFVTDKQTHHFFLIDDDEFASALIAKLLQQKVEIFDSWQELESKYEKKLERPMFWPENKPWPPVK